MVDKDSYYACLETCNNYNLDTFHFDDGWRTLASLSLIEDIPDLSNVANSNEILSEQFLSQNTKQNMNKPLECIIDEPRNEQDNKSSQEKMSKQLRTKALQYYNSEVEYQEREFALFERVLSNQAQLRFKSNRLFYSTNFELENINLQDSAYSIDEILPGLKPSSGWPFYLDELLKKLSGMEFKTFFLKPFTFETQFFQEAFDFVENYTRKFKESLGLIIHTDSNSDVDMIETYIEYLTKAIQALLGVALYTGNVLNYIKTTLCITNNLNLKKEELIQLQALFDSDDPKLIPSLKVFIGSKCINEESISNFIFSKSFYENLVIDTSVELIPTSIQFFVQKILEYSNSLTPLSLIRNYSIYENFTANTNILFTPNSKYSFSNCSALATDSKFIYVILSGVNGGMFKIGTGNSGTIKGRVYIHKLNPILEDASLQMVYCKDRLYIKANTDITSISTASGVQNSKFGDTLFSKYGNYEQRQSTAASSTSNSSNNHIVTLTEISPEDLSIIKQTKFLLSSKSKHALLRKRNENSVLLSDHEKLYILLLEAEENTKIEASETPSNRLLSDVNNPYASFPGYYSKALNSKKKKLEMGSYSPNVFTHLNLVLYTFNTNETLNQSYVKANFPDQHKLIVEIYDAFSHIFSYLECRKALIINNWDVETTAVYLIENETEVKENMIVPDSFTLIAQTRLESTTMKSGKAEFKSVNSDDPSHFDVSNFSKLNWDITKENYLVGYSFAEGLAIVFSSKKEDLISNNISYSLNISESKRENLLSATINPTKNAAPSTLYQNSTKFGYNFSAVDQGDLKSIKDAKKLLIASVSGAENSLNSAFKAKDNQMKSTSMESGFRLETDYRNYLVEDSIYDEINHYEILCKEIMGKSEKELLSKAEESYSAYKQTEVAEFTSIDGQGRYLDRDKMNEQLRKMAKEKSAISSIFAKEPKHFSKMNDGIRKPAQLFNSVAQNHANITTATPTILTEQKSDEFKSTFVKIISCLHISQSDLNFCFDPISKCFFLINNAPIIGLSFFVAKSFISSQTKQESEMLGLSDLSNISTFSDLFYRLSLNILDFNNRKFDSLWKYSNWTFFFSNLESKFSAPVSSGQFSGRPYYLDDYDTMLHQDMGNYKSVGSSKIVLGSLVSRHKQDEHTSKLIKGKLNRGLKEETNVLKNFITDSFKLSSEEELQISEVNLPIIDITSRDKFFVKSKQASVGQVSSKENSKGLSNGLRYWGENILFFSAKPKANELSDAQKKEFKPFIIKDVNKVYYFGVKGDYETIKFLLQGYDSSSEKEKLTSLKLIYTWSQSCQLNLLIDKHSSQFKDLSNCLDRLLTILKQIIFENVNANQSLQECALKILLNGWEILCPTLKTQIDLLCLVYERFGNNSNPKIQSLSSYYTTEDDIENLELSQGKVFQLLISKLIMLAQPYLVQNFHRISFIRTYSFTINDQTNNIIIKQKNSNLSSKFCGYPIWWALINKQTDFSEITSFLKLINQVSINPTSNSLDLSYKYREQIYSEISQTNEDRNLDEEFVLKEFAFNSRIIKSTTKIYKAKTLKPEKKVLDHISELLCHKSTALNNQTDEPGSSPLKSNFSDWSYSLLNLQIDKDANNQDSLEHISESFYDLIKKLILEESDSDCKSFLGISLLNTFFMSCVGDISEISNVIGMIQTSTTSSTSVLSIAPKVYSITLNLFNTCSQLIIDLLTVKSSKLSKNKHFISLAMNIVYSVGIPNLFLEKSMEEELTLFSKLIRLKAVLDTFTSPVPLNEQIQNNDGFQKELEKVFEYNLYGNESPSFMETVGFNKCEAIAVDISIVALANEKLPTSDFMIVSENHSYNNIRINPTNNYSSFGTCFSMKWNNINSVDASFEEFTESQFRGVASVEKIGPVAKGGVVVHRKKLFLPGREIKLMSNLYGDAKSLSKSGNSTTQTAPNAAQPKNKKKCKIIVQICCYPVESLKISNIENDPSFSKWGILKFKLMYLVNKAAKIVIKQDQISSKLKESQLMQLGLIRVEELLSSPKELDALNQNISKLSKRGFAIESTKYIEKNVKMTAQSQEEINFNESTQSYISKVRSKHSPSTVIRALQILKSFGAARQDWNSCEDLLISIIYSAFIRNFKELGYAGKEDEEVELGLKGLQKLNDWMCMTSRQYKEVFDQIKGFITDFAEKVINERVKLRTEVFKKISEVNASKLLIEASKSIPVQSTTPVLKEALKFVSKKENYKKKNIKRLSELPPPKKKPTAAPIKAQSQVNQTDQISTANNPEEINLESIHKANPEILPPFSSLKAIFIELRAQYETQIKSSYSNNPALRPICELLGLIYNEENPSLSINELFDYIIVNSEFVIKSFASLENSILICKEELLEELAMTAESINPFKYVCAALIRRLTSAQSFDFRITEEIISDKSHPGFALAKAKNANLDLFGTELLNSIFEFIYSRDAESQLTPIFAGQLSSLISTKLRFECIRKVIDSKPYNLLLNPFLYGSLEADIDSSSFLIKEFKHYPIEEIENLLKYQVKNLIELVDEQGKLSASQMTRKKFLHKKFKLIITEVESLIKFLSSITRESYKADIGFDQLLDLVRKLISQLFISSDRPTVEMIRLLLIRVARFSSNKSNSFISEAIINCLFKCLTTINTNSNQNEEKNNQLITNILTLIYHLTPFINISKHSSKLNEGMEYLFKLILVSEIPETISLACKISKKIINGKLPPNIFDTLFEKLGDLLVFKNSNQVLSSFASNKQSLLYRKGSDDFYDPNHLETPSNIQAQSVENEERNYYAMIHFNSPEIDYQF